MADDMCVNIFAGINRLISSLRNSVFQSSGTQTQGSSYQLIFVGLLVSLVVVTLMMQAQHCMSVIDGQKPFTLNIEQEKRD